jgi:hypothetical protein
MTKVDSSWNSWRRWEKLRTSRPSRAYIRSAPFRKVELLIILGVARKYRFKHKVGVLKNFHTLKKELFVAFLKIFSLVGKQGVYCIVLVLVYVTPCCFGNLEI